MILDSAPLWAAETNTYVIAAEHGEQAIVVDAPPDVSGIAALISKHDLVPTTLLVTHGHIDHVGGAGGFVAATGVTAYVHPADDFLTMDPESQLRSLFGMVPPGAETLAPPENLIALAGDTTLDLAGFSIDVLHTPGHTPGHCCFSLRDEGLLFSGDQLFAGSIGRTDLPGGDFEQLMQSMRDEVLVLDDDIRVLPGHGPETTIGRERRTNPFLVAG